MSPLKSRLLGAALCLVCLALVAGRVILSARALWRAGESALAAGDRDGAVRSFGRAARMYAPGNPYSGRALRRLVDIGLAAETSADQDTARRAFGEVRSAVLSTRGLYTPHAAELALADRHLAGLYGIEEQVLQRQEAPRSVFVVVALSGLVLFLGAAWALLRRGVDAEGRVQAAAGRPVLLMLIGFALLLLGLWRA